jgi:hypothetical protein
MESSKRFLAKQHIQVLDFVSLGLGSLPGNCCLAQGSIQTSPHLDKLHSAKFSCIYDLKKTHLNVISVEIISRLCLMRIQTAKVEHQQD